MKKYLWEIKIFYKLISHQKTWSYFHLVPVVNKTMRLRTLTVNMPTFQKLFCRCSIFIKAGSFYSLVRKRSWQQQKIKENRELWGKHYSYSTGFTPLTLTPKQLFLITESISDPTSSLWACHNTQQTGLMQPLQISLKAAGRVKRRGMKACPLDMQLCVH